MHATGWGGGASGDHDASVPPHLLLADCGRGRLHVGSQRLDILATEGPAVQHCRLLKHRRAYR